MLAREELCDVKPVDDPRVLADRLRHPGAGAAAPVCVLLVEDDLAIQRSVSFYLTRRGYEVETADNGDDGLQLALTGRFDVVLLDVMLPHTDGLGICRRLRARYPTQPILITSARAGDLDKITGLEYGADDYVAKPFSPAELEARIRAVLRRSRSKSRGAANISVGQVSLDLHRREATANGEIVRLTPKEFDILHTLMRVPGRVFTRAHLLERVWSSTYHGYTRAVDAHVIRLRAKLQERLGPDWDCLESIYGIGYRYLPPPIEPEP